MVNPTSPLYLYHVKRKGVSKSHSCNCYESNVQQELRPGSQCFDKNQEKNIEKSKNQGLGSASENRKHSSRQANRIYDATYLQCNSVSIDSNVQNANLRTQIRKATGHQAICYQTVKEYAHSIHRITLNYTTLTKHENRKVIRVSE